MISSSPERRDEPDSDLVAKPHVPDLAPPSHFSASDSSLELSLAAAGRCLQEWWFGSRAEVVAFAASKAAWEGERSLPSDGVVWARNMGIFPLMLGFKGVVTGLNWMAGYPPVSSDSMPGHEGTALQQKILRQSISCVGRWRKVPPPNPEGEEDFWNAKVVNSYGMEVHVPQNLGWANIAHSLPAKGSAGVVDALEVCSGGVKDFLKSPTST